MNFFTARDGIVMFSHSFEQLGILQLTINRLIPYTCFCDEQSVSLSFITAVWWLASVICFKQPKSSNFEKSSNSEKWPRSEKNASPAAQKKGWDPIFFSFCPTYIWGKSILQKTAFNLVKYGLQSPTYDLHLHIGGRHSVLYFSIQATEKYSTAVSYTHLRAHET